MCDTSGGLEYLNITSHEIQKYLKAHNIVPCSHEKYSSYFSKKEAQIALTYEWNTSFRQIRAFLNTKNVAMHNDQVDPDPSNCNRIWIMISTLCCCCCCLKFSPLPEDIDEATIFIDILLNDQNNSNVEMVLDAAEVFYRHAPLHVAIGTKRMLNRSWCLWELAVRAEQGKKTHILRAKCEEGEEILQGEQLDFGLWHAIKFITWRGFQYTGFDFLRKCMSCTQMRYEYSLPAAVLRGEAEDHFETMEATVPKDKETIQENVLKIFGSKQAFNLTVATIQLSSRVDKQAQVGLVLLEGILWVALMPVTLCFIAIYIPVFAAGLSVVLLLNLFHSMACSSCCAKAVDSLYDAVDAVFALVLRTVLVIELLARLLVCFTAFLVPLTLVWCAFICLGCTILACEWTFCSSEPRREALAEPSGEAEGSSPAAVGLASVLVVSGDAQLRMEQ
jgi:hypothetical protein